MELEVNIDDSNDLRGVGLFFILVLLGMTLFFFLAVFFTYEPTHIDVIRNGFSGIWSNISPEAKTRACLAWFTDSRAFFESVENSFTGDLDEESRQVVDTFMKDHCGPFLAASP